MISTHVLDTHKGVPATGIPVKLQIKNGTGWSDLGSGVTNADGRFSFDCEKTEGTYQLTFEVEDYLSKSVNDFFYVMVPVIFKVKNTDRKYHVPLLLNPFGYSTYRGT